MQECQKYFLTDLTSSEVETITRNFFKYVSRDSDFFNPELRLMAANLSSSNESITVPRDLADASLAPSQIGALLEDLLQLETAPDKVMRWVANWSVGTPTQPLLRLDLNSFLSMLSNIRKVSVFGIRTNVVPTYVSRDPTNKTFVGERGRQASPGRLFSHRKARQGDY